MQEIRRVGDRVQTLGASLGLQQDDPALQEILNTLARATIILTTGFRRAAAAAANEREGHRLTNDMLNRLRFGFRGVEHELMAQTARAERAEERVFVLERQEEYLRQDLAVSAALSLRDRAAAATLRGSLAQRRGEAERLRRELADAEMTLYGFN